MTLLHLTANLAVGAVRMIFNLNGEYSLSQQRRTMVFKRKSFSSIMATFTKAKSDLDKYIGDTMAIKETAHQKAQDATNRESLCAIEIMKAEDAIKALNKIIGE